MPGTPESIETHYVNAFRDGIAQAFQQTESVFDPYVLRGRQKAEFDFSDRIGVAEDMTEDTTRYGDNPMSEIEHDRRRITLYDFELGKAIDEKDLKRVAEDPKNAYTQAMMASTKRKRDDFIIERYFGKAYTGKKGDTEINFVKGTGDADSHNIVVGSISAGHSNPVTATDTNGSNSIVAVGAASTEGISVGGQFAGFNQTALTSSSGLTLAKLKGLRATMLRLEAIEQDTVLNCFLSARQIDDLLDIEQVRNMDYNNGRPLAEGRIAQYMGFRFIHTERLPLVGNERRVIVSLPKAFQLNIGEDTGGDMWRLPGKKKIPYIYFKQCIGGTREWGEVAAEIRCAE